LTLCSYIDNIGSYMNIGQLEKLRCAFPKLTEANQFYILGLVEGLKQAQGKISGKLLIKTQDSYIEQKKSL